MDLQLLFYYWIGIFQLNYIHQVECGIVWLSVVST